MQPRRGMMRASEIQPAVDLVLADYVTLVPETDPLREKKLGLANELKATRGSRGEGRGVMASLERLKEEAAAILAGAAQGLVEGTLDDMEAVAEELANDLVEAAATGNEELLNVTVARVRLLGERQRIRATDAGWEILQGISKAIFAMLKEALLP